MDKTATRQILLCFITHFPMLIFSQVELTIDSRNIHNFMHWSEQMNAIRQHSPDSAIQLYQWSFETYLEDKDTLNAVNSLIGMAIAYGHIAQYQSAYDNLWKALLLADQANNAKAKIPVYIILGRYYSFYKRKENALDYFHRALSLNKELVTKGEMKQEDLVSCYSALSSTYRELDDLTYAKVYLDSCLMFHNPKLNKATTHYLTFTSAVIDYKEGRYQIALDSLHAILNWFKPYNPGFQVLIYTHIGDVYQKMKASKTAESYYQQALKFSVEYNSHMDFTPMIHERLAKVYVDQGAYQAAFASLQKEKELNAQFFDSRSENNRSLLEIKDEFRVEKEKQNQLIQERLLEKLEHEEQEAFLKNMILLVSIVFLVFAGVIYFNYVRNKHRTEKQLIQKKKELEIKQAEELLAVKNRELAASSLKLIEKDEFLAELKEKLSQRNGNIKPEEVRKIVRTISHSKAQNWEEFEARFISVNKEFYQKLNINFPKLSRGDQKLCALIKLNLSSKEMAKLLGISIESVHTSRYRLRKKLGLDRNVSLTEFVAKF